MRLREHAAIQPGALDIFRADPRQLVVQQNYNVRDLTTPDAQEKLRELAESIAEIGVTDPLVVRFDGERIIVVEGHRRLAATLLAIEGGAEIRSVPIYQEARGVNDAQRDLGLIVSNSGEPLTPLEKAKVVGRLVGHGWSHQEIAKRCGWKSVASVLQYLDMLAMPEAVKQQVRDGDVSATVARKIVKDSARDAKDDPEFAAELIRANKEENKRLGVGKRAKVTPKTINRDKPKAKPDAAIKDTTAHTLRNQAPAMVAADSEQLPPVSAERVHETPVPEERDQDIVRLDDAQQTYERTLAAATAGNIDALNKFTSDAENFRSAAKDAFTSLPRQQPQSRAVKDLLAALKPFADLCNDFDPNEKADDDIVEVFVRDVKRAWEVYTAATGGSEEAA